MVAVKSHQADAYLKSPPPTLVGVLLFGTDEGLIAERAQALAKRLAAAASPPGEILRIDESDLDSGTDRFIVELGTIPMFGGRKIVRASQSRRVNAQLLQPLIEGSRIEGVLIIEAGNLKADDAMRLLFEKSAHTAAVGCYADEARDLEGLVRDVLAAASLAITPEARRLLVSRLGADRALSRAEVEKLAIYCLGKTRIEESDVDAIVGDASELALDRIVAAALGGNATVAVVECERAVASGESPQLVLITLQRHLQRLHRVRAAIDAGASMDDALRGLRPPVFFKQRHAFTAEVQAWTARRLQHALGRIGDTMRATRGGAMDEAVMTERLLIELARLVAAASASQAAVKGR